MDVIVQPVLAKPVHDLCSEKNQHDANSKFERCRALLIENEAEHNHANGHDQQRRRVTQAPEGASQQELVFSAPAKRNDRSQMICFEGVNHAKQKTQNQEPRR